MSAHASFSARLLAWYDRHGRRDLPWQHARTPYRVWVAEIMLQQTQVAAVVPYFQRFLRRFPDLAALAAAPADDVLQAWAGLGYYARARNLQRAAQIAVAEHGGALPAELPALLELPGIGRSTAAAVLAQAHGQRHAILDGNVKRVLARYGAVDGWPGAPAVARALWSLSESLLPQERLADYTQAIMDLGATLCTARKPQCARCPVQDGCAAHRAGRTADFPAARPRRQRPLRQAQLLLVQDAAGRLLLERRPPAGIWGGLWCLPLAQADEDAAAFLRGAYGLHAQAGEALPTIAHAFTHFDLHLRPLRLHVREPAGLAEQAPARWIDLAADALPGLPAPVARLLQQLAGKAGAAPPQGMAPATTRPRRKAVSSPST
ncbi:MAG: A/G-specific adenine glycosylase [Nevskia sp.]|nr:A/G-specific adenine glycosylase [Nevskia sp.]